MSTDQERPIARCPSNEVEAYYYPFYIKKAVGMEVDFLLLDIHLLHMTSDEKEVMGELIVINSVEDLEEHGFPKDDMGVYIIGENLGRWFRQ
jgi:hypothetical protein